MTELNLVVDSTPTFNGSLVMHNGELCMSSLDIASYTGKNHFDVMRDIRNMFDKLGESKFACSYKSAQNKELPMYYLNEDDAITLVAGYDVVMRRTIVQEWNRLKKENYSIGKPLHEMDEEELIEYSLKQVREKKRLIQQNQQLENENKQKEAIILRQDEENELMLEKFFGDKDLIDFAHLTQIINIKGLGRNKFYAYLVEKGVLIETSFGRKKSYRPYRQYAQHFELRGSFETVLLKTSSINWMFNFLVRNGVMTPVDKKKCIEDIKNQFNQIDDLDALLDAAM